MSRFSSAVKATRALSAALVAKEIREIVATFDDPKIQNEKAFATADGRWLTVAQVKEYFGPQYATHPVFLEQMAVAFIGRWTRAAFEKYGINPASLTDEKLVIAFEATAGVEKEAVRLLTAN